MNAASFDFAQDEEGGLQAERKSYGIKFVERKAPYQGGSHDEVNEWPNCDEKTNTPGEMNQQLTQMLPTSQR